MAIRARGFQVSIRALLIATFCLAVCFLFASVEHERSSMVTQLKDAGATIEYAQWSLLRPTAASRVKSICIPAIAYDSVDTKRLECFPMLETIGIEEKRLTAGGKTFRWPTIQVTKPHFDTLFVWMEQNRDKRRNQLSHLPMKLRSNPRPLTDSEWELMESATDQPAFLHW